MNEKDVYFTYNGFNRPAMVMGVPLMLLLLCGFIATFGGFIFIYLYGLFGMIIPILIGCFLYVVRVVCENDPNALRGVNLSIKGMVLKLYHRDFITGFDSGGYK